jgi:fructokinase
MTQPTETRPLTTKPATIVGLGEVLWDLLPSGKQLGGAPANFAYMANVLGDRGVVASRVGADALGREARDAMDTLGITTCYVEEDAFRPTGTVEVRVDAAGQPEFTIAESVAWDALEWTPQWAELASKADVLCYGSLAQRAPASRATIRRFLEAAPLATLRVYDVNLRHTFFTKDVLHESLQLAHVVKLNDQELPRIADLLALGGSTYEERAQRLLQAYHLRLVCITRGDRGSLLLADGKSASHPGFKIKVADAVGAGDAFTACLAHNFLRGAPLDQINEEANRLAAWVATQVGATPSTGGRDLSEILAGIGN